MLGHSWAAQTLFGFGLGRSLVSLSSESSPAEERALFAAEAQKTARVLPQGNLQSLIGDPISPQEVHAQLGTCTVCNLACARYLSLWTAPESRKSQRIWFQSKCYVESWTQLYWAGTNCDTVFKSIWRLWCQLQKQSCYLTAWHVI